MNTEQTKDDSLLQSSTKLRPKIMTWSFDYNWHQRSQCFCFWLNSVKKPNQTNEKSPKPNKTGQSIVQLDLLGEREELKNKSTGKNLESSSLQMVPSVWGGKRRGEAKQSKENLKLRLPCFSVIFPRYVGDSYALAQCLGMNICSVRYDSPMAEQWNIGYFVCWQQVSGCLRFY